MPKPKRRSTSTARKPRSRRTAPSRRLSEEEFNKLRYGRNWASAEWHRSAMATTGHRCVLCGKRSQVLHHAWYRRSNGSLVKDSEVIGKDVFPLDENCHTAIAHSPQNWIRVRSSDPVDRALGNHNTPAFHRHLQQRFQKYAVGNARQRPSLSSPAEEGRWLVWLSATTAAIVLLVILLAK